MQRHSIVRYILGACYASDGSFENARARHTVVQESCCFILCPRKILLAKPTIVALCVEETAKGFPR